MSIPQLILNEFKKDPTLLDDLIALLQAIFTSKDKKRAIRRATLAIAAKEAIRS